MISPYGALLPVYKPPGVTSFDVIRKLNRSCGKLKAGHAGTLDKPASGLLLVCLGKATKLISWFQNMEKEYSAVVRLGIRTDTDDMSGEVVEECPVPESLDGNRLDSVLDEFRGPIEQLPPAFSALKVNGKRASDRVRSGEAVTLKKRSVTVYSLEAACPVPERLELTVRCSKGTYIRSLARDLGKRLGSCGTIETLHRSRIGPFLADNALSPENFSPESVTEAMIPLPDVLDSLPSITVPDEECPAVLNGRFPEALRSEAPVPLLRIMNRENRLLALAEHCGKWKYFTVFPEAF